MLSTAALARAKIICTNKALTCAVLNDHLASAMFFAVIELPGVGFVSRKLLHQIEEVRGNQTTRLGFVPCKFIPII